jgi:hypothetical protein
MVEERLIVEIIIGLFGIVLFLSIYFLPCIVAASKNHSQRDAIGILTFFLGWTFIGWVVALVWASTNDRKG